MKTSTHLAFAVFMLAACADASAQTYKCTDAAGKVTYSSTKCSELKLKDAGEVQDRIQITPALRTQPPAPPAARSEPEERKPAAAAPAEKEPERRCFTVAGPGGKSFTRCNDKPDE